MHKWIAVFLVVLIPVLGVAKNAAPLFGNVTGVASEDVLNVRVKPNYKAYKVGTLPPGAMVGIERCSKIGRSQWCRVYQLVQNIYSDNFYPGWVNARFLQPSNRGYVQIKDRKNDCYYALRCRDERCEVVIGAFYDDQDTVTQLQKEWIDRKNLRGESRFGAAADDIEGYCTFDHRIEAYEKKKRSMEKRITLKTVSTDKLTLSYPVFMKVDKGSDGSITVYYDKKLKHYSGSDERDNAPLLYKKNIFNLTFSVYPTLKAALKKDFGNYGEASLSDDLEYDAATDWFKRRGKEGFVEAEDFYGIPAYKIMIGVEGSGIIYHYFKQHGKTVVVSQRYDHNPPLDLETRKPISGKWSLPNDAETTRQIIKSLKVH